MQRTTLLGLVLAMSLAGTPAFAADAGSPYHISDPAFARALDHLNTVATAVAEGKDGTGSKLLGPARDIAITWSHVSAQLAKTGMLVEEAMTNRAVQTFENDWKTSKDPRADANEITGHLADLFATTDHPVPSDVYRVAYLNRAIMIDASHGQWNDAQGSANDLSGAWSGVRASVAGRDRANESVIDHGVAAIVDAVKQRDQGKTTSVASTLETKLDTVVSKA